MSGTSPAAGMPAEGIDEARATPPRRVLHVYRRFHPDYTGDGIYFTRLIPLIARHGVANEVLAFETDPGEGPAGTIHKGIPVHYLSRTHGAATRTNLMRWLIRHGRRYDVIHLHSHIDRTFLTYGLARLFGRQVLFSCTLDDSPPQLIAQYRPRYRRLVRALLATINRFVVISPYLLRRALETVPPGRLRFIPQGGILQDDPSSPEERARLRGRLGAGQDDLVLLNVGSISRRKNVLWLVEALALIPDPGVRLVVVGPVLEADYAAEIEAAIRRHGLAERVVLTGFEERPEPFYRAADAFVFSSVSEGFGNVYVEAMAHRLPIITRFLPGITDFIIQHGTTGFLVDTPAQFGAAVGALRADPALGARMGAAGRRFAERNLELGRVARAYAALYRDAPDPAGDGDGFPDFRIRFTRDLAAGPAAIGLAEIDTPTDWPPLLQVVIDTEAAFEWDKGTYTDIGQVAPTRALEARFEVFRRHGVLPALVVDYPVATREESAGIIRRLAAEGCEVGVHLHPWSAPPMVEPKDDWHSFSGNLGPDLERIKLAALTEAVARLLGRPPSLFKAGRYGLSPDTVAALGALGFAIDLSICPGYDYTAMGGPDFSRFTARPGWFAGSRPILSLPTTAGHVGWLSGHAAALDRLARSAAGRALRFERLAARANALYPLRLSPEGTTLAEMRDLTRRLLGRGLRVFTLTLHSPTLAPGNTPYTRTEADLVALLERIDRYLAFFRDELGGQFTTPSALHARLSALRPPGSARPDA
ncbi:glycosyltransferase [Elioraea sp. Yellowstone]|jgi:teichuronic acid biosynthesis glycosyltransferase TuaC|uniref:glycosyltransferase n=1 Tax=Elioraea sp. Yellowstone TaxID=2592070 RepID=UPI0013867A17|nr:glycosyltransferase [Elioraea sp. Yellowstone]